MTAPGAIDISFRGAQAWRGMSTQSRATPGMFELLENCYVSSDGMEIRPIPGFRTYLDLSATRVLTTGAGGYSVDIIDARRPVFAPSGNYNFNTTKVQEMKVYADKTHVHGFDFVGNRLILFGESNFRIEPILNDTRSAYVTITAVTFVNAARTTLTLSANYLESDLGAGSADFFNSLDDGGGGFPRAAGTKRTQYRLFIRGLSAGVAGTNLNNLSHDVDAAVGFPAVNQVNITTGIVGAGNNLVGQTAEIGWVSVDHVSSTNSPSDDVESLTIWTVVTDPLSPATPSLPLVGCRPAHVANRQRDFGDAITTVPEGGVTGCSRRRQRSLPYRLVPAVAGDRLLFAAPAYNCCFQAPVTIPLNYEGSTTTDGVSWIANDIYDKPRCVGVPKAIMYEDTVKTSVGGSVNLYSAGTAPFAFGGSGNTTRTGRYKFAVSYRDVATGEEGLPSEPITIDTDNTNVNCGIRLVVMFPGYLMPESLALSVNVYRTQKNGEQLFFDRTIPMDAFQTVAASPLGTVSAKYGVQPGTAADQYRHTVEILVPYTTDEILKKHQGSPQVLSQMPMGAKAVRTMRGGWTVYGGALGNNGKNLELWKSAGIAMHFNPGVDYPNSDEVFGRIGVNTSAGFGLSGFENWGCAAQGTVPPAYAGQELFSRDLFPYPRETVRLNKIVNNVAASAAGVAPLDQQRDVRFQIDKSPLFEDQTLSRDLKTTFLKLPRAQLQISEADNPGVTPATNTTVVGKETGEDIEGIGEANGQLVACTRGKTYIIGFSQSPIGAPPELATGQFGCIGANTMVNFDLGCAWISDRGPCAVLGGGFKWIGEPIQHLFTGINARYLRDKNGMMRHSWACHDPERGLLYFGMFADRADGTANEVTISYRGNTFSWDSAFQADDVQSRFPCDEVIAYSYRVDSWSVWRPPLGLSVKWMARGVDQQSGKPNMFFLGSDDRVYMMDDSFAQWNVAPITCTVMSNSTGAVIATNGTFGTDTTARGNGTYWQAGMEVLVVSQAEGRPLIKRTTLVSISGSNVTVADSVAVTSGDSLQIGVRAMSIRTNFVSIKNYETGRTPTMGMRYSLDGTADQTCYVKGGALTTQDRVSESEPIRSQFTKGDAGLDDYVLLGSVDATADDAALRVVDQSLKRGAVQGTNARLEFDIVGAAAIRLQDIYGEVQ